MIKSKKIISVAAAAVLSFSLFGVVGCKSKEYQGEKLDGFVAGVTDDVASNGGFAVEKGDYVYFINGKEESTANNTYGKVVKGSLMRISKADLAAGKGSEAKIVVSSLMVSGNYSSGIYIYGDYVYYATPTADKDSAGQVANTSLDFKRAKLDGSEAPMDGKNGYFFRLSSNDMNYRFVEDNGSVYCMYEQDGALKSYSVATGKTTVLVSGASGYFYDTQDLSSPVVYYTMSVSKDLDDTNVNAQNYNQIFSVSAGNTVEVDSAAAAYKAKNAKGEVVASYDFDEKFLKDNADANGYDLSDYTTYPYVNLGQLVLDGIGATHEFPSHVVMTEEEKKVKDTARVGDEIEQFGYTYTLQQQANGGVYFTRSRVYPVGGENAKLCYIPNARSEWNPITANGKAKTQTVATDTTSASATALYSIDGNGVHSYVYVADALLKRTTTDEKGNATGTVTLAYGVSGATLWKLDGDYAYYYNTGTNGKNLSRVNYKGEAAKYNPLFVEGEYSPVTLTVVDWADSWYKPEIIKAGEGSVLLYPNAQSFGSGSTAYNYIYATKLSSNVQLKANVEKTKEIEKEIESYTTNPALQSLMRCYYRTGGGATYDTNEEIAALYPASSVKEYDAFKEKFGEGKEFHGGKQSDLVYLVGRMNTKDTEEIEEAWASYLLQEEVEETESKGLPTWAIVLIVVGGVLVVATAVAVPLIVCAARKKARKKREEAIVSAYKRKKIDTTDDKTIDVYAEEDALVEEEVPEAEDITVEENEQAEEATQEEASTQE